MSPAVSPAGASPSILASLTGASFTSGPQPAISFGPQPFILDGHQYSGSFETDLSRAVNIINSFGIAPCTMKAIQQMLGKHP